MHKALNREFFNRPTLVVARNLLGKYLVRKRKNGQTALIITEVEAYDGFMDKASHASRGKTKRTEPMFGPPGHWFVYFTYGVHWMLNVVTREKGYPAAILIRGVEGVAGPGRLTKYMGIDKRFNTLPASRKSGLWIEDRGIKIPARKIKKSPRVGVNYAGSVWVKKEWRFFVASQE